MKDVSILINNGVNVEGSLELFGDIATYDETVVDFLESVDNKLEDINKYKEASDMTNYSILVHSLKSDAKYLGLTVLAEMALNHEMESKNNNINYVYNNYDALVDEANKMIAVLRNYMGETDTIEIPEKEVVLKDKTILIVDDSDVIRSFIKKVFDDSYEVVVAHDGKDAIDVIGTAAAYNNLVCMLLDLNMPNINGFEVLDYLHENNLFAKLPVSIITGDDSKEKLCKRAHEEFLKLLAEGTNEENFNKVKDAALNQYQINSKNNSYWQEAIYQNEMGQDVATNHEAAIKNLTLEEFNAFIKNLYNRNNRMQVIMNGIPVVK